MPIRIPPGLTVLRHAPFARFVACRFLTVFVWQMLAVAVGWQVYALTHDALALGLVGLSEFLPFVGLVLFGGHVADTADRRRVLLVGWGVDTLCIAALLALTVVGVPRVWPIYAIMATFGAARAFWWPVTQALVPTLVPLEQFGQAVGVNSTVFQVAVIAGPIVGGLLFLSGAATVFGVCLALFVLTMALVWSLRVPRAPADAPPVESTGHVLLEGLRFVLRARAVLGVISLDLFAVLFGGATALLPIFARDVLHVGPAGLGALRTAPGVGAALAAIALTLWPLQRRAGAAMFAGVALFGAATLVFGLSHRLWLSLIALGVLGAGDMASVYVRGILLQLSTPDAIRGRVSAVNAMFIGASNELGEFESGLTARWWGAVRAVVYGALMTLGVVGAWIAWFPELRRLDRFEEARRAALSAERP